MKVLLDTHTFLWFIGGDAALSVKGRACVEDEANEKLVSIVSLWEFAIKNSIGKLSLAKPFGQLIPEQLRSNGFEVLGLRVENATILAALPFHHRDPFDRMLISQCLTENITLISRDDAFDAYGVKRSW